jgi:hypothetical protein
MTTCIYDTRFGEEVRVENCQQPYAFASAVDLAYSRIEIQGDILGNGEGYDIWREAPLSVYGGVFGGLDGVDVWRGAVTFVGTEFRSELRIDRAAVVAVGTLHSSRLWVKRGALTVTAASFDAGALIEAEKSLLTVSDVSWRELETPVVTTKGGTLRLSTVSITETRGTEPVVAVDGTVVVVENSEACGLRSPFLEGSCMNGAACFVRRSQLSEGQRDVPLLLLDGLWTLTNTSLLGPESPGSEVWGLADLGALDARTFGVHVWPGAQSGSPGIRGNVAPIPVLRSPVAFFTPPAHFQCPAAVPDPEFLGFDPAMVPGAYAPYPSLSADDRYAAWWEDDVYYDGDRDGLAGDGDGVPAMWDCYPNDPTVPFGPEVGGNGVDEDCDGMLSCFLGADEDGDGFFAWSAVPRDAREPECAALPGREDPDDDEACVPNGCDSGGHTGATHTGEPPPVDTALPPPRQVVGLAGSSCSTAAVPGPAWLAVLALAGRRRLPRPRPAR